ncbi:MAG TPA: tRNA (adenosine(37)-N6)-threonylcarbamoyltransferase complex ATPase subunit type 1 TsaE [Clostridia bacterium]
MIYTTYGEVQTFDLGVKIAKTLKGGEVITLDGQLGAGKTVFTKGLAHGLGVETPILSPTFVILRQYKGSELELYHFDMYRLESSDEALELGFDEYIGRKTAVTVIEWADKVKDILNNVTHRIKINFVDDLTRTVEIL